MEHRHAIVIDEKGNKTAFVLVAVSGEDGTYTERPLYYEMQEGEGLVYEDIEAALGMLKPQWTEEKGWTETATEEELAAAHPETGFPQTPDPVELAIAELTELVLEEQQVTALAIAEIFEIVTGGLGK